VSCTLYYQPVTHGSTAGGSILRDAICDRYGHEGELDTGAVEFLDGLAAAGVEGAAKLIAAIEKHGRLRFWKEC
jgi:hypothetical protein